MAEDIQTAEIAKTQITNQGFLANVGNSLEKIKKFSNEPAVQRSIPVMITLFVIFIGMVLFISSNVLPKPQAWLFSLISGYFSIA